MPAVRRSRTCQTVTDGNLHRQGTGQIKGRSAGQTLLDGVRISAPASRRQTSRTVFWLEIRMLPGPCQVEPGRSVTNTPAAPVWDELRVTIVATREDSGLTFRSDLTGRSASSKNTV